MRSLLIEKPFGLDGELALITGGGSGLGLGIARCFAKAGARVVLVGRNEDALRGAACSIGSAASFERCDIAVLEDLPGLIRRAEAAHGPVSILVNNAGNHLKKPATETSDKEFARVLNTHLMAAFALTREAARSMVQQGRGSVLFTASMASYLGIPLVSAYSAAKAAYLGLVRSVAAELAGRGIRVNAIAPGWIETDMVRNALAGEAERRNRILARTPMARFGTPEEIGLAAVFLCSPAASFITGAVLPVDGGARSGF